MHVIKFLALVVVAASAFAVPTGISEQGTVQHDVFISSNSNETPNSLRRMQELLYRRSRHRRSPIGNGNSDVSTLIREEGMAERSDNTDEKTADSGSAEDNGSEGATKRKESVLDTLYIYINKPALASDIIEPVFKERSLAPRFNNCVIGSVRQAQESELENSARCYEDDEYNDRLQFEMNYKFSGSSIQRTFETNPPAIQAVGELSNIADPRILSSEVKVSDSTAKVVVGYRCKTGSNGTISLKLTLRFGEGDSNETAIVWKKKCASGENKMIAFGHLLNDKEGSGPIQYPFPGEGEEKLIVRPSDVSTELFLKLQHPGAQQEFLAPYATSSNTDVTPITVRGTHPSGGILQGLLMTSFQISYECLKSGSSEIQATIGIPPYNNFTASWEKDCGGSVPRTMQVGTSEGGRDVVENGQPAKPYQVAIEHIGTPHNEEHFHLPGNQSDWSIYITVSDGDETRPASREAGLHIGRITTTVEKTSVMAALTPKVSSRGTFGGWSQDYGSEHVVSPGDMLQVSFHFMCREIGEGRILISVPVLQYGALEFGIAKECDHVATAHKSREFVWTVGKVFWAFVLLVVASSAFFIWRRRRITATDGFKPVSVTES